MSIAKLAASTTYESLQKRCTEANGSIQALRARISGLPLDKKREELNKLQRVVQPLIRDIGRHQDAGRLQKYVVSFQKDIQHLCTALAGRHETVAEVVIPILIGAVASAATKVITDKIVDALQPSSTHSKQPEGVLAMHKAPKPQDAPQDSKPNPWETGKPKNSSALVRSVPNPIPGEYRGVARKPCSEGYGSDPSGQDGPSRPDRDYEPPEHTPEVQHELEQHFQEDRAARAAEAKRQERVDDL